MNKIQSHNGYLFVEVPEDAKGFIVTHLMGDPDLVYPSAYGGYTYVTRLPPGNYTLVGRGRELSEEQWKPIVEKIYVFNIRKNEWEAVSYMDYKNSLSWDIKTKKESGLSLIESLNMSNPIILKNEK